MESNFMSRFKEALLHDAMHYALLPRGKIRTLEENRRGNHKKSCGVYDEGKMSRCGDHTEQDCNSTTLTVANASTLYIIHVVPCQVANQQ